MLPVQDTDTECFREGYDMLEGYDLVVQVSEQGTVQIMTLV